tara:strand:+ start:208 stop:645 length:438 start_codon:yes stop_codon:yes gene_type:complete
MKRKKTDFFCMKNIVIISIILLIVVGTTICAFNFIENRIIKEGLSSDQFVDCTSHTPLLCGTRNTSQSSYPPSLGTCYETYGPESQDPCGVLLAYCVDEPPPNMNTPAANQNASVNSSICNLITHRKAELQAEATYTTREGKDCR